MPRALRIEYEGAFYHVLNRGDRREPIFRDDADRKRFLETLGEACAKTDWQVHALCLMANHFHLVVETPKGNLVAGMKWFLGTYTVRFNRRHKLFGHLFSGRYKALVVDATSPGYFRKVCEYVHLNPVREELAKLGWKEADLTQRRKGDPGKVRIARQLRQETTMTLAWIAQRLQMGVWMNFHEDARIGLGHGPRAPLHHEAGQVGAGRYFRFVGLQANSANHLRLAELGGVEK